MISVPFGSMKSAYTAPRPLAILLALLAGTTALAQDDSLPVGSFPMHGQAISPLLPGTGQGFGETVSIDGDYCIIGCASDNWPTGNAFIYARNSANAYQFHQALTPPAGANAFGTSVAIDGDTCVVGAEGSNGIGGSSSAHIYARDAEEGSWNLVTTFTGAYSFGFQVAIDGDTCVISTPSAHAYTGSAHVFTRDASGAWSAGTALPKPEGVYGFGKSLSIHDGTCVVGSDSTEGSAHVYTRDAKGQWSTGTALSRPEGADYFGRSVSIHGDTCIVGARNSGTVYNRNSEGDWNTGTSLDPPQGDMEGFGSSVVVHGDTVLIQGNVPWCPDSYIGQVYVYAQTTFTGQAMYSLNFGLSFGSNIDFDGRTLLVGARASGLNGQAFSFVPTINGACCVSGACAIIEESSCSALGGTFFEGLGCDAANCTGTCPADLNGDGQVDGQDLAAVLAAWGLPCDG